MMWRRHLLLLLAILLPAMVAANGKYVTAIVMGEDPAIPVQRAAIRFADGVQTLVVESTFVTDEAGEVAWILPLPAEPTEIEVVSPGLIETMAFQFVKDAHDPIMPDRRVGELFLFILVVFAAVGIAYSRRVFEWTLVLLLVWFLALIATPNFLSIEHQAPPDADKSDPLIDRRIVGDYEVAVLKPASADELADWLVANQFGAMDEDLSAAVEDHIREGWCFTAARLMGEAGSNSPHPLSVTFPTDRAVYPMRLTGQGARGNTQVDLFVFGPDSASHPAMREVICGSLVFGETWIQVGHRDERRSPWTGHKGVVDFAGDSAVMTRLSRSFTPAQMRAEDLWLEWKEEPETFLRRDKVYPFANRGWMMMRGLMIVTGIGLIAAAVCVRIKLPRLGKIVLWSGLAVGLATMLVVRVAYPFEPVRTMSRYQYSNANLELERMSWQFPTVVTHEDRFPLTIDEVMELLLAHGRNPFTGGPIREMDSPGNYFRRTREDGEQVLVAVTSAGAELELELAQVMKSIEQEIRWAERGKRRR